MKLEFVVGMGPQGVTVLTKDGIPVSGIVRAVLTVDVDGERSLVLTINDFELRHHTEPSSAFVRGFSTREMQ